MSSFKALDEDETRGDLKELKEALRRMKPLYNKCHGSLNFLEAKEGIEEDLKGKLEDVVNLALATRDRYRLGRLVLAQNLPQTIRTITKGQSYWDETVEEEVGFVESLIREEEKARMAEDEYDIQALEEGDVPEGTTRNEDALKALISDLKEIAIDLTSRRSNIGKVIARLSSTSSAMSYDQEALKEIKGKILGETEELKQTKQELASWNEKAKGQRERLEKELESLKNSRKPDSENSGGKAGETVEQFTVVDELVANIKRGYHEAKARVFQKVDDIFDKAWSKWMRKPAKAALRGSLFLGSDFIIKYIIDSGWFKSFLSVAYNMLQAGKSMVEVIGYGIAWAFMKLLRGIFWLIEKIIDVTTFITGALGLSTKWFDRLMDKYIDQAISWVNDKILYFKEKVMGAVDRLADAVGTMVNSLFAPVLMGMRAIMSEFGNLLYNFSKVIIPTLLKLKDGLGGKAREVLDSLLNIAAKVGATGTEMMPEREQVKERMELLLHDFTYAMMMTGLVTGSDEERDTLKNESVEMELARELAKDSIKLETMHLIAEQIQETTFIRPLGLYWIVLGRIQDMGTLRNVYFKQGTDDYIWDKKIADMFEWLYDFDKGKPRDKAIDDATAYFYRLANAVGLNDKLKDVLESEFTLLKVLHMVGKKDCSSWNEIGKILEEEGLIGEAEVGDDGKVRETLKRLDVLEDLPNLKYVSAPFRARKKSKWGRTTGGQGR